MYTEFVSADGLCKGGREILMNDLRFHKSERPMVAQFFTATPAHLEQVAKLARELGFDGVDINMGCPDRAIEKQGAGASLIKNPSLAKELIAAAKQGAGELPVSVKTRIGYNKNELETWLPVLLEAKPAAIVLHARTRKEMSKVPAHWDQVKRAIEIARGTDILIVGNGDVIDISDAKRKAEETGADGVMLGRAIFGNPWLFADRAEEPTLTEKLRVMVEHTQLFEEQLRGVKSFALMKKHYKAYCSGFDGAKELRLKLMEANDATEVAREVEDFLKTTPLVSIA